MRKINLKINNYNPNINKRTDQYIQETEESQTIRRGKT